MHIQFYALICDNKKLINFILPLWLRLYFIKTNYISIVIYDQSISYHYIGN